MNDREAIFAAEEIWAADCRIQKSLLRKEMVGLSVGEKQLK